MVSVLIALWGSSCSLSRGRRIARLQDLTRWPLIFFWAGTNGQLPMIQLKIPPAPKFLSADMVPAARWRPTSFFGQTGVRHFISWKWSVLKTAPEYRSDPCLSGEESNFLRSDNTGHRLSVKPIRLVGFNLTDYFAGSTNGKMSVYPKASSTTIVRKATRATRIKKMKNESPPAGS